MLFKIEFDIRHRQNLKFTEGCSYNFRHPNGQSLKMTYMGPSRIDGFPFFDTLTPLLYPMEEYEFTGIQIDNAYLIRPIEDNIDYFIGDYTKENKQKVMEYLFELHNITPELLRAKDSYKSIIRNIKLDDIL